MEGRLYSVEVLFQHQVYLDKKDPAFKKFTAEQETGMQAGRSHGKAGGDDRVGIY